MAKKMLLSMHFGLKPELIKIIFETDRFPMEITADYSLTRRS